MFYKTTATSGEKAIILQRLRQGETAPAIAHELGFTIAVVCDIRNEALRNGEYQEGGYINGAGDGNNTDR